MTTEKANTRDNKFVPAILPWIVAAGALIVYLLTLNRWLSFSSLGAVARVSGWTWQPEVVGPVYWLATLPLRLLPDAWVPVGLNLFSAICAVLVLALLARSVALLPHNKTEAQRIRERSPHALLSVRQAWVPPVLAVVICGLQLSFWENATSASGEMLDLLLFAYVIRCLLEYRIDARQSWLLQAGFIYGAAMTNNWAMIGFLPLFLIALVWTMGLSFFNTRFLGRMSLCGLAGLSFYLLLPVVDLFSHTAEASFWQVLKTNLSVQKTVLQTLVFNKRQIFNPDYPLWVLALPSLLPVLVMAVRWPSFSGDVSRVGVLTADLTFHLFYAVMLGICTWVALDPQFSPRHYHPGLSASGILLLPFYYLGALSAGYFSGYLLLVFGKKPWVQRRFGRRGLDPLWQRVVRGGVIGGVFALGLVALVGLLYRNLPQVRLANGPLLKQFAALLTADLPRGAVLFSDDPRRTVLVQAELSQSGRSRDYVLVDTGSLKWPDYHRFLKQKYPENWPGMPPAARRMPFEPIELIGLAMQLVQSNGLYYLHPSFGYYFEIFDSVNRGLVYQLEPYPTNSLFAPPVTEPLVQKNESFWSRIDADNLAPLVRALTPPPPDAKPTFAQKLLAKAHLPREVNREASILAGFYSRALDSWGVDLQRAGRLREAEARFARALELNPENVVAKTNLQCNRILQAGGKLELNPPETPEDQFGRARTWDQVISDNGPFDEPGLCLAQAKVLLKTSNYRQAAREFARVMSLVPEDLPTRLLLAHAYLVCRAPDEALKVIDEVHRQPAFLSQVRTNYADLLLVEASAHLAKNDVPGAEAVVRRARQQYPADDKVLATAAQTYMLFNCHSNALEIIEQQLKKHPHEISLLVNKGFTCLQLGQFEQAIAPLTRVIESETANFSETHYLALFNRAIAYLRTMKLDEARRDYEVLEQQAPKAYKVKYGLGEIAYQKQETNAAIRYYEEYLANGPTNTAEANLVRTRLAELKAGSP